MAKNDSKIIKFDRYRRLPEAGGRIAEGGRRFNESQKLGGASFFGSYPRVSVITAVFNGEAHLENTIKSIVGQSYPNLEFIVIDGGSRDGTLDILRRYDQQIDYWVSEPDRGISDAFNKGIQVSTGTYLNFQGDGDGFIDKFAVEDAMKSLEGMMPEACPFWVATRILRVSPEGKALHFSPRLSASRIRFLFRMAYPHQGLFSHVRTFEKWGLFDLANRYCMDYEHLLRSYRHLGQAKALNRVTACWRADGLGTGKTAEILKEYDEIKRKHHIEKNWILSMIANWSRFKFWIRECLLGSEKKRDSDAD